MNSFVDRSCWIKVACGIRLESGRTIEFAKVSDYGRQITDVEIDSVRPYLLSLYTTGTRDQETPSDDR